MYLYSGKIVCNQGCMLWRPINLQKAMVTYILFERCIDAKIIEINWLGFNDNVGMDIYSGICMYY